MSYNFSRYFPQRLNDETIPVDLPMTQRMLNRGYTSTSINQSVLRDMDLSFFPPPPRGATDVDTEDGSTEEHASESRGRSSVTSKNKTRLPSLVSSSGKGSMSSGSINSALSLTRGGSKVSVTVIE